MITVATVLFKPDKSTPAASRCYDVEWVNKLYRAFCRSLTVPHRFVVFVDTPRVFYHQGIHQSILEWDSHGFGSMIEPFKLNEPTIIAGLDTLILDNVNHYAEYCLHGPALALVRDPYRPERSINPIALVPAGNSHIYWKWRGANDMEWLRRFDSTSKFIDDMWPRECLSLKFHDVRRKGPQGAKVIYFHGKPKQHQLLHLPCVQENWT